MLNKTKTNVFEDWFSNPRNDILSGLVVAFAMIPEAIAFSGIAGVDPQVGLFGAFCISITIAIVGGRMGMITSATGSTALLTNWSEMNSASKGFKPVGVANGVTVSSGLFSFAVTGVYRCSATFHVNTNNDTRWIQTDWAYTPNGGAETSGDTYNYVQVTQSDTTYSSFMREKYWNIAHTGDTVELRIGSNNGITVRGSTDQNGGDTWVFFEKVAEAV